MDHSQFHLLAMHLTLSHCLAMDPPVLALAMDPPALALATDLILSRTPEMGLAGSPNLIQQLFFVLLQG